MFTKPIKTGVFAVIVCLVYFSSCTKFKANRETITTQDNATCEVLFNDVFKIVDEQAKLNGASLGRLAEIGENCPDVTIDNFNGGFPKTATIDYGTDNCIDLFGVARRGKVIAVFNGPYKEQGSFVEISFENYYRNNDKADGTMVITNNGTNADSNQTFTIQIVNGRVLTVDGYQLEWEGVLNYEWVEGADEALYIFDDIYKVTGTAAGVNRDNRVYTMEITEPAEFLFGCPVYRKGKESIIPENLKERTVDYGDGFCDNQVTVSTGRKDQTVTVR